MTAPVRRYVDYLRIEQVGGAVLLAAAALALVAANSPLRGTYERLRTLEVGPDSLHLRLSLATWAADGLLAVFFFVAGLEVKRELVVGELADRRSAALPVIAAVGGMVVPALVFLAVAGSVPGAGRAWAIPVATDIAFALGVLAVAGRHLPSGLRLFLLSLAVVDDLGAIALIAVLYTSSANLLALAGAVVLLVGYAVLQRLRIRAWWLYVPLAATVWALVHESGVHATVAGVALGLLTRVRADPGEEHAPAELLEHRLQPLSAGVCVPLFAFFAAGLALDATALRTTATDRVALGIAAGLILGKTIGVAGGAWLAVRLRIARLPAGVRWGDIVGVGLLGGCGFTVSLLISKLAFPDAQRSATATIAVLTASALAAVLAAVTLSARSPRRTNQV